MLLFFIEGVLVSLPALAVTLHLEALGFSIVQIVLVDGCINAAWMIRFIFPARHAELYRALAALFWALLPQAVSVWMIVLLMTLSETCTAVHHTSLERYGINASVIRAMLIGQALGSLVGGALKHEAGHDAVYIA